MYVFISIDMLYIPWSKFLELLFATEKDINLSSSSSCSLDSYFIFPTANYCYFFYYYYICLLFSGTEETSLIFLPC